MRLGRGRGYVHKKSTLCMLVKMLKIMDAWSLTVNSEEQVMTTLALNTDLPKFTPLNILIRYLVATL